jgi:hypothetical protein
VNIAVGGFKGGLEVNYFFDGGAESGGYPLAYLVGCGIDY